MRPHGSRGRQGVEGFRVGLHHVGFTSLTPAKVHTDL